MWGSSIGLAGCGMGHKIEAGCGIWEILGAGYGMKITWWDRDALISIGGMRDSFEIVGGMRDLNSKWPFENLTRRDRDKDSGSGGMAGWSQNKWWDAGFEKPILDPLRCMTQVKRSNIRFEYKGNFGNDVTATIYGCEGRQNVLQVQVFGWNSAVQWSKHDKFPLGDPKIAVIKTSHASVLLLPLHNISKLQSSLCKISSEIGDL